MISKTSGEHLGRGCEQKIGEPASSRSRVKKVGWVPVLPLKYVKSPNKVHVINKNVRRWVWSRDHPQLTKDFGRMGKVTTSLSELHKKSI